MRYALYVLMVLVLSSACFAQSPDSFALLPDNIGRTLLSRSMTLVSSSYTVVNPGAGAVVATVTIGTGETGYILGYRCGGTVQGFMDLYSGSTRKYRSAFFGDYDETAPQWQPDWQSLTAAAASTLSVRCPSALTGTYSATIYVGKTK